MAFILSLLTVISGPDATGVKFRGFAVTGSFSLFESGTKRRRLPAGGNSNLRATLSPLTSFK